MNRLSNDYTDIELAVRRQRDAQKETVSLVIPHFNSRLLLERCLFGIMGQSYPLSLIEVVVSDDGSASELCGLQDLFRGSLNLKVLTQERKGFRLATVRNRGLLASE